MNSDDRRDEGRSAIVVDAPSLGELLRRTDDLKVLIREQTRDIVSRVDAFEARVDATFVRQQTYDAQLRASTQLWDGLTLRLAKLEDNQSWLVRAILMVAITAVLAGLGVVARAVFGAH